MKKSGRFYRLSQERWEQIKGCFHRRKGRKGLAPRASNCKAFEAVLSRERTGRP